MTKKKTKRKVSKKKAKDEKTLFAKESITLSEERTLLSFIRTGLAILGIGLAVLKLFTHYGWWSYALAIVLVVLGLIIIIEEFPKLLKKKRIEHELENKRNNS